MVLVCFEVIIKEDCMEEYLSAANKLKDHLARAKGFVRSERFASLVTERKLLSLSVWENEDSVNQWRNRQEHRRSQKSCRETIFESYTITVASVLRSYTDQDRQEAPEDSNIILEA